jgi:hypothetical protein
LLQLQELFILYTHCEKVARFPCKCECVGWPRACRREAAAEMALCKRNGAKRTETQKQSKSLVALRTGGMFPGKLPESPSNKFVGLRRLRRRTERATEYGRPAGRPYSLLRVILAALRTDRMFSLIFQKVHQFIRCFWRSRPQTAGVRVLRNSIRRFLNEP